MTQIFTLFNNNRNVINWAGVITLVTVLLPGRLISQDLPADQLKKGIDLFYVAKFDEAILTLRQALKSGLNKDEMFDAYVHIGFSLVRSNEQKMLIDHAFAEAIKIDPVRTLNSLKIPPDLIQRFEEIKKQLVGNLYVVSNPPGASVMLLQPENDIEFIKNSPAMFSNLLVADYNLIVSRPKYQTFVQPWRVQAGTTDTVRVLLEQKSPPLYKRWWAWGGGLALAGAAITYIALAGAGDADTPPATKELPPPVIHPKP